MLKSIHLSGRGDRLIILRSDVPNYKLTGSHMFFTETMGIEQVYPTEPKDVPRYTSPPPLYVQNYVFIYLTQGLEDPELDGRYLVTLHKHIKFDSELIKLHLDLVEAGVKYPFYLRIGGQGWISHMLVGSEADAVMAAAVMRVNADLATGGESE